MFAQNTFFEISGLIMLLIVFAHTNFKKTIKSFRNKFFVLFTWIGIFDIIFDILSTVMISYPEIYSIWAQELSLQILYVMQLTLPFMLFLYVVYLRSGTLSADKVTVFVVSIPYGIMIALAVLNPVIKCFFSFNEYNQYQRENLYPLMYIYGLVYLILCLVDTIIYRKKISFKSASVIWEFAIVSGTTVAIQMYFTDVLLTGFGIAAAIIIMLLTLQNPYENIDTLTGAYSINGIREKLDSIRRHRTPICFVVLSVDNLKRINHVFGMETGDKILKDVSNMLQRSVGEDNVFRFLGDTFAVTTFSQKQMNGLLDNVDQFFETIYKIYDTEMKLSACITTITNHVIDAEVTKFLSFIDYVTARTKSFGPGSRVEATDYVIAQYRRYREIEEYLFEAIDKNLFEVYFQPIYSLKEGRFVSIEALARLSNDSLGPISPDDFITIAEKSGQISSIDRCLFIKVCEFLRRNPQILDTIKNVKFNISPPDLLNANFGDNIIQRIESFNLDPKIFQFEITETAATQYGAELNRWVKIMKKAGCGICLDDFGSGYANLDAVTKLPFDVIKLDKSLLYSAMDSKDGELLYNSVFNVMQDLNYNVVAEGAENEQQLRYLRHIGVDYIQGFYFSKPLPEEELINFIENNK